MTTSLPIPPERFGLVHHRRLNSRAGLDRDGMNTAVTDQGLDGIFAYMGSEEKNLRANPVDQVGKILGDLF